MNKKAGWLKVLVLFCIGGIIFSMIMVMVIDIQGDTPKVAEICHKLGYEKYYKDASLDCYKCAIDRITPPDNLMFLRLSTQCINVK